MGRLNAGREIASQNAYRIYKMHRTKTTLCSRIICPSLFSQTGKIKIWAKWPLTFAYILMFLIILYFFLIGNISLADENVIFQLVTFTSYCRNTIAYLVFRTCSTCYSRVYFTRPFYIFIELHPYSLNHKTMIYI